MESLQQNVTQSRLKESTLLASWLSQKKQDTTRRNYAREWKDFFHLFPELAICDIEVGHLSVFLQSKEHLKPASRKKSKDALSSFLSFCVKVGYLDRNPAMALDSPRVPEQTGFRILSEEQVFRLMGVDLKTRELLIIKLLYYGGLRVSELCGLKWRQFSWRNQGVQMTVVGKGQRTRSILISRRLYDELLTLKQGVGEDAAVFRSQKEPYAAIQPNQVRRLVKRAGQLARLNVDISPHWLRHCHATHALERGAPIHIVQKTLGHASLVTTGKYLDARPLDSSSKYLGGG